MFALESMALGKPVVTYLKPDVVDRSAEGYGIRLPVVPATKETLVEALRPLVESPGSAGRSAPRAAPTSSRCTTSTVSPTACSTSTVRSDLSLAAQLKRLVRHSAIYGLGGIVSRLLAVILLPLYTNYLPPTAYGQVEIVTAATAVLVIVLQLGISSAFFRFYFDTKDPVQRLVVVRTSFWFTMTTATVGLVDRPRVRQSDRPRTAARPRRRPSSAPARSASGPRPTTSSSPPSSASKSGRSPTRSQASRTC